MQALILAGGRGMRLNPLTNEFPVPLLYVPGGTLLDYLLHHLYQLPIEEIGLVLQYHGDQIARHVADHQSQEFTLIPQYPPFTLMSALATAAPWVNGPTLVIHGNRYFSQPLDYFLEAADPSRPSFLIDEADGNHGVTAAGAYLLPPEVFYLAAQRLDADSLQTLNNSLREERILPHRVPLQGWAQAVHNATDLLLVNRYLLRFWHETPHPPKAGIGYDALSYNWISPEADVEEVSGLFATVGPHVSANQCRLYNTMLLPGVTLQDAKEQHAVLATASNSLLRLYVPSSAMHSLACK